MEKKRIMFNHPNGEYRYEGDVILEAQPHHGTFLVVFIYEKQIMEEASSS